MELMGISKRFGKVLAVNGISLDVDKGEWFSFLGPSGCGKTTCLRMIGGLTEPTEGRIYLNGREITYAPPNRRNMAMVFQNYALFPHMSVRDNIAFGLKMKKVKTTKINDEVTRTLELVGLPGYENRSPKQLSGGEQQRVALARSIVTEPEVILFDEPLSNLDAKLRIRMRVELLQLQEKLGVTAIYVTHDQSEALAMSDRVAIMRDGSVVQIGVPQEIYENPSTPFVADFIGRANILKGKIIRSSIVSVQGIELAIPEASKEGETVTLSIRPERIEIMPNVETDARRTESNVLPAIVKSVEYEGPTLLYHLFVDHLELIAQKGSHPREKVFGSGDRVLVRLKPEDIVIIPSTL